MANFKDIKRFNGSSWDTYKLGVEDTEISDGVGSISQGVFPMTKGKIGTWTANRFAGFPGHNVWYQYSADGGATWIDLGKYSDTGTDNNYDSTYGWLTYNLFTNSTTIGIIPNTIDRSVIKAEDFRFRVVMDFYSHVSYTNSRPVLIYLGFLNQIIIGLTSTSPSTGMWVTAKRTSINETHTITTNEETGVKEITRENAMTDITKHAWSEAPNFIKVPVAGDSGFNDIKTNLGYFGGGSHRFLQFEFGMNQWPDDGRTPQLMSIWGYSNSRFSGGNPLSNENKVFYYDYNGNGYAGTKDMANNTLIYTTFPLQCRKGLRVNDGNFEVLNSSNIIFQDGGKFILRRGIYLDGSPEGSDTSSIYYGKKGKVLATRGDGSNPYWRDLDSDLNKKVDKPAYFGPSERRILGVKGADVGEAVETITYTVAQYDFESVAGNIPVYASATESAGDQYPVEMLDNQLFVAMPKNDSHVANKKYVDEQISLKTSNVSGYLGTVEGTVALRELTENKTVKEGDYCRASAQFIITDDNDSQDSAETVHIGDLIIAKNASSNGMNPTSTNWDIIHTEDVSNYVTLDTQQAITGAKTFTNLDVDTGFLFLQGLIKFGQESYEDSMGRIGWRLYAQQLGGPVPGDDSNNHWKINFPHGFGEQTIATQEWVKANTICSSTIDQEFFNSLY